MEALGSEGGGFPERLFNLTLALCRVTDRFGAAESAKSALRGKAFELLRRMFQLERESPEERRAAFVEIRAGIRDLDRALLVVQKRGLVRPVNFQVLRREYGRFSSALAAQGIPLAARRTLLPGILNRRQEQILHYLTVEGEAALPELLSLFPGSEVSPRTLERDIKFLLETRTIRRLGERRWAKYAANGGAVLNVV